MFAKQAYNKILFLAWVFLVYDIGANLVAKPKLEHPKHEPTKHTHEDVAPGDMHNTIVTGMPRVTVKGIPSLKKFGNGYYYFETTFQGNYFQALQFCNHHGMNLLSVESKEEQQFVTRNLQTLFGTQDYFFWTSGTILPDNHWVWLSTGEPIAFTDWGPNQPDNLVTKEECLELRYGGYRKDPLWHDDSCSHLKLPICEIKLTEIIQNANETTVGTPWNLPLERFGDQYYYFGVANRANYFQALQYCNYHGMDLLSIETRKEQDFVVKHIQAKYGTDIYAFWTSGTTLPNDHWVWLTTGEPIAFTHWFSNQPDNYKKNEHCLELGYYKYNRDLLWNDHICTVGKHVICEIKPKENILKFFTDSFNLTLQTAAVIEV